MPASSVTITLQTPLTELAGVGPAYTARLDRLNTRTVSDLLHYFPRRYDDLRAVKTLDELQEFGSLPENEPLTLRARILAVNARRSRQGRSLVKASIGNDQGFIEAVWFNQPYLAKQLHIGNEYIFAGKLKVNLGRPSLQSPTFELASTEQTHTARLVPVYPETEGVSSKWLRSKIKPLLSLASSVSETLPETLLQEYGLLSVSEALEQIHFPKDQESATAARRRFDFAQLLNVQLANLRRRQSWQGTKAPRIPYDADVTRSFVKSLPWPLTEEQRLATHQVLTDLNSDTPMIRLLQGDVGSGKTAVAAIAMHQTAQAGFQAVLMAPTEVLTRQHAVTLNSWFTPRGVPVTVLLGSSSTAEKKAAADAIRRGSAQIIVGTHALIQEHIEWHQLGLAVVDEQHRFGVEQREALRTKHNPHLLTMTATPIPRSLALVRYADQDLSIITTLPAGRQRVVTEVALPPDRPAVFGKVRSELSQGRQAYVVYPLIEESVQGLRDATAEYQKLSAIFREFKVGLLHGRLKSGEKEAIMDGFKGGQINVLAATSVIEVGIDVPNATVMVIEEAQQFGLAQLHQFRGRVGRGGEQSYCYLIAGNTSGEENERLQAMVTSNSGFALAEIDFRLRGPGDLLGTRQSGFDVSIHALSDHQLLEETRQAAARLLAEKT